MRTTIRITPPGGEAVEVKTRLTFRIGGIPTVGDSVPVIYDPTDPESVEVDDAAHLSEVSRRIGTTQGTTTVHGGFATEVYPVTGPGAASWAPLAREARDQIEAARKAQMDQVAELHRQGVLDDTQYEAITKQISGE